MLIHDYPKFLLALCIWREARGENLAAKRAVAWVIMNRVTDVRWPNDIVGVVTQPFQFSSFNKNDPNAIKFPRIFDAAFEECCSVVENLEVDPTSGCNHYHSIAAGEKWPDWAMESKRILTVGPFKFYKL